MPRRIGLIAGSVQAGSTCPIPARLLLLCQRLWALPPASAVCSNLKHSPGILKGSIRVQEPRQGLHGASGCQAAVWGPRAWPWAASSVWFSPSCLRTSDAVSPRRRPHSGEAQRPYTAGLWELLVGPEALLYRVLVGPKVQVLATRVPQYPCRHTSGPSDHICKSLLHHLSYNRGWTHHLMLLPMRPEPLVSSTHVLHMPWSQSIL